MKERDHALIWLIAGEPSGDLIGARLIAALKSHEEAPIRITGIGGEAMSAEGLKSRFPISDIAVMGIVEVVPRLPVIRRRIAQTIAEIRADMPDVVVSIDSPGFCSRIWKGLSGSGIPLVHYVAPSVWAWDPGRAARYARWLDHMIALLPFEPLWFEREGLKSTFAGHPVLEGGAASGDGQRFRERYGISGDTTVVCVLPGSRRGEILRMLPTFREAADSIFNAVGEAVFVFPSVSYLAPTVYAHVREWSVRTIVVDTIADKFDAMAASDAAMATSGTVSLELAMAGVPHVIAYRISHVTAAIVRLMGVRRNQSINLINILLDRRVVPEFLQRNCNGPTVAAAVLALLRDAGRREEQSAASARALDMLRPANRSPSAAAAAVVLAHTRNTLSYSTKTEQQK